MQGVEAAEKIVRALYYAFARRDVEAALGLADPAIEFWAQGTGDRAGRTEPYRGHEGLRRYFDDVAEQWEELRVEPDDFRIAGNGVIVFGTAHGIAGGKEVSLPVIWVWKLRGGRVVYARAVATVAEATRLVGA